MPKNDFTGKMQKLPKNLGDLGKLIVAKGFKKLPKLQEIAKSGHTDCNITTSQVYDKPVNFFKRKIVLLLTTVLNRRK